MSTAAHSALTERRSGPDRRRRATPMFSRYWLIGRRRGSRRADEARNVYLDRYARREWALIAAVFGLCMVDWLWTLAHLSRGVEEANPLLAWTLEIGGPLAFSIAKVGISVLAVGFLLLHVRFRITRRLIPLVLLVYAGVLGVHLGTEVAVS